MNYQFDSNLAASDFQTQSRDPAVRLLFDGKRVTDYTRFVIKSFRDARAKALFQQRDVPALRNIERAARRKLEALDSARQLGDLAAARGNNLEALKGNRLGQHSIRINDQYRICFVWQKGDASNVEIVDYHR